jgi:hypothetical protein
MDEVVESWPWLAVGHVVDCTSRPFSWNTWSSSEPGSGAPPTASNAARTSGSMSSSTLSSGSVVRVVRKMLPDVGFCE